MAGPPTIWHHAPARWHWADGELVMHAEPDTDFWQRTHYGFRRDNGHLLGWRLSQDFVAELVAEFRPVAQYDQAGLMVRVSPGCWLKASIEFEPDGPSRLGAVVTNAGYSDWATQDVPRTMTAVALRVRREGGDVFVDWRAPQEAGWQQMRIAHLLEAEHAAAVLVGAYACAPQGGGFEARFRRLRIERATAMPGRPDGRTG